MNNRTNYSLIGFLVIFSISMMLGFGYWLLKPSKEEEMQKYHIYFSESVLGLNLDAPVKFRGINVGKVVELKINPKNSEEVEVLISILKTTPIRTSTAAKLTSQGITGLSYINLTLGDSKDAMLELNNGNTFPVIKTTPSMFIKFEKSLRQVSTNLSDTLEQTKKLLNDENQAEITKLLKHSVKAIDNINKILTPETIKDIQDSVKNLNSASLKLDKLMPKIDHFITNTVEWENKVSGAFEAIMGSYNGIRTTMDLFKAHLANGNFNFKGIAQTITPNINNTLLQSQELMIKLENAIEQYERSPGDVLIQEETKKAPGER